MVELVYTGDLKSPGESLAGSSPAIRTISKIQNLRKFRMFDFIEFEIF
jgi:hypothetical protein